MTLQYALHLDLMTLSEDLKVKLFGSGAWNMTWMVFDLRLHGAVLQAVFRIEDLSID